MADESPESSATDDAPADGAEVMDTDAGKRALQAERERAKALERQLAELKPLAEAAKKAEDEKKSEVERLTEQVQKLTQERDSAMVDRDRYQVALDKGLTVTQAKRLVGRTADEFTADADELLADLGAGSSGEKEPPAGKPREALSGGGDPTEATEPDIRSVIESIPRR